jgi:hypothetical protein
MADPITKQVLWHYIEMLSEMTHPESSQRMSTKNLRFAECMFIDRGRTEWSPFATSEKITLSVPGKGNDGCIDLSAQINASMRGESFRLLTSPAPHALSDVNHRIFFNPTGAISVVSNSDRKHLSDPQPCGRSKGEKCFVFRTRFDRVFYDLPCRSASVRYLDAGEIKKRVIPNSGIKVISVFIDGGLENQFRHKHYVSHMTGTQFTVVAKKIDEAFHRPVVERCKRFPSDLRDNVRIDDAAPR